MHTFDNIATELGRADLDVDLAELTWATWMHSAYLAGRAVEARVLAARVGLSEDATAHIAAAEQHHRERILAAHDYFRRLAPIETEVKKLLARAEREPERNVWKRLVAFARRGRGTR
jgi:2-oxo-4-hydroxy-4-carboxy--5-ureidoimidazoline (OHCU) decarboxylase